MSDNDDTESREFPAPYVRVRGRISRSGQVTWSPCLRTNKGPRQVTVPPRSSTPHGQVSAEPGPESAVRGGRYTVTLLDYRDEPLDSAAVVPQFLARERQWAPFVARLPYRRHVQAVAMSLDERELGRLTVPTDRPYFTLLRPTEDDFIDPTGVLHLHWAGHDSEHPVTFFIRYTHNGRDWLRPGVNLHTNDYYLDLNEMPGGKRCLVQVLGTNGYRTSYVQTRHFEVPDKAPDILLTDSDGPVLLAQGFSRQNGPITTDAIRWLAAGQQVGQGTSLDVRTLSKGTHEISVVVSDETGKQSAEHVGTYDATTGARITTTQPL